MDNKKQAITTSLYCSYYHHWRKRKSGIRGKFVVDHTPETNIAGMCRDLAYSNVDGKIVTFHDARFCNSNVCDTHFRKQMLITPNVVLTHYCLEVWCKTKMTYILLFTYTDAKTL